MACTPSLEKYKGFTLLVKEDWVSIVMDGTGFMIEGPAEDDEDVKRIAAITIPTLRLLARRSM